MYKNCREKVNSRQFQTQAWACLNFKLKIDKSYLKWQSYLFSEKSDELFEDDYQCKEEDCLVFQLNFGFLSDYLFQFLYKAFGAFDFLY